MDINNDRCNLNQGFGVNPQVYAPLKGHTGVDVGCGYGSPIHSPVDMYVYKVLTVNAPSRDGSGFTGVFGIVDDGIELYEYLIGHCDPSVQVGQNIKAGDVVRTEANHGEVFQDGVQITLAMQKAGDKRGAHRHCQKRPLQKVLRTDPAYYYLDNYSDNPAGSIYRDLNGYYYQVWDWLNGYNGCWNPIGSVFNRDLTLGATGYDVFVLQRLMVKQGVATFAPTGYFGNLSQIAVGELQKALNINPDAGYFGPKTRAAVQQIFSL
jgi:hypothetical protein